MTGLDGRRVYLDWNASAPLRPEARDAMLAAMDEVGNPSSVHAEGRKAKAIVERARAQVAAFAECDRSEVVFCSGATEAAAMVLDQDWDVVLVSDLCHDCIFVAAQEREACHVIPAPRLLSALSDDEWLGLLAVPDAGGRRLLAIPAADGETGLAPSYQVLGDFARKAGWAVLVDATQVLGRAYFCFSDEPAKANADFAIASSHKIGGAKGAGALLLRAGTQLRSPIRGGGQESGRRSGTENVTAIAGFGAAAEAALLDGA
ncbi:MAG: aminotransferase class V-fold PLP-dependent enzyme, partial [Pseudomonadota bacterium]